MMFHEIIINLVIYFMTFVETEIKIIMEISSFTIKVFVSIQFYN